MKALASLIAIALVVGAFAGDARPATRSDDPGAKSTVMSSWPVLPSYWLKPGCAFP